LKYLNSSAFGLRTKVSSIRQAVGLLGHRSLRQWVSLIAVEELSK
jgi:EAL and modified HD-GYP domain-containing signal transduction protein